ncbi:hypothetical protein [Rubripirellula reticaptiva]|uniref:hypothetical protein n=1 Tax=Rubripirellula reticaptiva TaxID=2528013 RepID=UPI0011B4277F|nr:hypothetical protein [Rubripirellula reticaptiva]
MKSLQLVLPVHVAAQRQTAKQSAKTYELILAACTGDGETIVQLVPILSVGKTLRRTLLMNPAAATAGGG